MSCSAGAAIAVEIDSKTNFESLEKVTGVMHMTTTYASLGPIAGWEGHRSPQKSQAISSRKTAAR